MPEGPEVRRITDKLRARLKRKRLCWISWTPNTKYSSVFSEELDQLFPATCLDVICRGKRIFFFFDNGLAFMSTLGMEGHWYYFDLTTEEGRAARQKYECRHGMFCLHFGKDYDAGTNTLCLSEVEVWYDDMIKYGNFTVGTWNDILNKVCEYGPDLLATTCPLEDIHPQVQSCLPSAFFQPVTSYIFKQAIRSSRRSHMELCRFLMKQIYFTGVGNYLKSEVLYRAKLHPNRVLGSLTEEETIQLHSIILTTIKQAYECGGLTHGTFLDPDMEKGDFPVHVYKKAGRNDPQGYPITAIKTSDGRTTYLVEAIQI